MDAPAASGWLVFPGTLVLPNTLLTVMGDGHLVAIDMDTGESKVAVSGQ